MNEKLFAPEMNTPLYKQGSKGVISIHNIMIISQV